ncbi:hypothetical protein BST81_07155 [Leptolyngbya sp. 'hensonii']|uniref:hypothetical protein n=1 Tax=Leptolyngbya sp. 'hensonii' TaxID=1922337 RepID=UPI00094FCD47|nr:hypothetical protein [Leptolyngbya sp. 'hensonii']OLP18998.1 hypothetical protein BST81_07155 [Leptolyngbya sp. 'hensonii']
MERAGLPSLMYRSLLPLAGFVVVASLALKPSPACSQPLSDAVTDQPKRSELTPASVGLSPMQREDLDLQPEIIESSPVLRRWREKIPDVMEEIAHQPSFRTRLRVGYSQYPSTNQLGGLTLGVEDVFLGQTPLTLSADYQTNFDGRGQQPGSNDRSAWGANLKTYLLPLGNRINLAPVLGYRHLETNLYVTEGLDVGFRLLLVLSRGGGADISLTQTWVAPGSDNEVGVLTFSVGYALTHNLRISTDIQQQNSRQRQDSRVGILLEWML